MYQVISDQHDYLAVKFTGKVDKEEYQEILANLTSKTETGNQVDLLVDLTELERFTVGALWEDIKFDVKNFIMCTILNDKISSFFQNFQFLKMSFF